MALLRFLFVLAVGAAVLHRDLQVTVDPDGTYPENVVPDKPPVVSDPGTPVWIEVPADAISAHEPEVFPLPPGYDENDYFWWQLGQLGWQKDFQHLDPAPLTGVVVR